MAVFYFIPITYLRNWYNTVYNKVYRQVIYFLELIGIKK